jgi:hypothetical protein
MSRALAAVVLSLLALAVAGCGSSSKSGKTVDSSQVEQGIKSDLSTSSVKVTSAKCPSDVKSETGAKLTCSVTFSNGATGKVEVTQTSSANTFTYTLEPGSVQIPGAEVEKQIQKDLAAQGIAGATVNCPDNIVVKVGTTVTCNVSGAKGVGTVTYTFSSQEGTVDSSSVKAS